MLPGVYFARKKSGEPYYRASITYLGKHISLEIGRASCRERV